MSDIFFRSFFFAIVLLFMVVGIALIDSIPNLPLKGLVVFCSVWAIAAFGIWFGDRY